MRDISIIIPTYNEERILNQNLYEIYNSISKRFPGRCRFTIVDSNSTDKTPKISKDFVRIHKNISYANVNCKGKGGKISHFAVRCKTPYAGWIDSDIPLRIDEYCRMMDKVISHKADIAISSRYAKGAKIKRRLARLIFSRAYHTIVKLLFLINVSDTTSGAKFWNIKVAKNVWPMVKGERWFFDTELVYYCIKNGYRIVEIPVTFKDRNDSRFSVFKESYIVGLELLNFRIRTLFSK